MIPARASTSAPLHVVRLERLIAGGVLTSAQVDVLSAAWPCLDADTWSHPCLRDLREHTRALVEELRQKESVRT